MAFSNAVQISKVDPLYLRTDQSKDLGTGFLCYSPPMTDAKAETFTERFNRLTDRLSRKQIGQLLDLTDGAVRKLQNGMTQTLKAHGAIALARHLQVPVEYLAERGPLPMKEAPSKTAPLLSTQIIADGLMRDSTAFSQSDESGLPFRNPWPAILGILVAILEIHPDLEKALPADLRSLLPPRPPLRRRRQPKRPA